MALGSTYGKGSRIMTTETFDFASPVGQTLSGQLELPRGRPRGWALFAHCFTCGKDNVAAVRISRGLAELGIGTLRFDFTGLGSSEGEFATSGFSANVSDLVAAAAAMAKAGMPVSLLVGHSLGGAAVLAAAGDLPAVRAVATIAAPYEVAHALSQFAPDRLRAIEKNGVADVELGGRSFAISRSFVHDLRGQLQGARIAALGRPLLIMHAPLDAVVGIENAGQIFAAARHPKNFVAMDGADHLMGRKVDAEFAATMIGSWASRYLPPIEAAELPSDVVAEETGAGAFQLSIEAAGAHFLADEPVSVGGLGSGPTPYNLLSAALAACTTMTVRLYARKNGWKVDRVRTAVGHVSKAGADNHDLFTRRISVEGAVDAEQRARLIEIAGRCPVHRTLMQGARVITEESLPRAASEPAEMHERVTAQTAVT